MSLLKKCVTDVGTLECGTEHGVMIHLSTTPLLGVCAKRRMEQRVSTIIGCSSGQENHIGPNE